MLKRLLILSFLAITISSFAQREDFRTWWAAELRGELLNQVDFKVTPEVRFFDNSSRMSSFLTDLDVSTPFLDYFRAGGQYRFERINTKNAYLGNRFGVYLKVRYKIDRFRLGYRAMYHWEFVGINTSENGNIPDEYHRHKFSLSYYRKRWDLRPAVSVEYFSNRIPVESAYEQKFRFSAGLDYKLNKKMNLSLSYKYQKEYFANNPLAANIIATKITFEL